MHNQHSKEFLDYYSTQYRKKKFVLRFTLFVHHIPSKVSSLRSINEYNADFQITLNKLQSSGAFIPDDLILAAYLHKIEDTHSDFDAPHRSAA